MILEQVNKRLAELAVALPLKIRELQKAEYEYITRFSDLVAHSGMGNAQAREAEAITVCKTEGLLEPLYDLRGEYRALYQEKECLTEIGRNLRALQVGQSTDDYGK